MIEEKLDQLKSLVPEIRNEVESLTSAINEKSCTNIVEYWYQILLKLDTAKTSTDVRNLIDEIGIQLVSMCYEYFVMFLLSRKIYKL